MTSTPNTPSTPNIDSAAVAVTGQTAVSIIELLAHCEAFLRTASPAVRAELLAFCNRQPTAPDAGWLIDMLGFNARWLQAKLTHPATLAGTATHTHQAGDWP
jgi:hypothetical protein